MTAVSKPKSRPPSAPTIVLLTTCELMLIHSPKRAHRPQFRADVAGSARGAHPASEDFQARNISRGTVGITYRTQPLRARLAEMFRKKDRERPGPALRMESRRWRDRQRSLSRGW